MGNLNVASIGQIQAGALAAGNLALVVPALLGGTPLGYQPIAGVNPDGSIQPVQPPFLFHYEGENKVTLESDITDHYVETNSPIEDSITLHPKLISVHGFIGELNNIPSGALSGVLAAAKTVTDKLQGVSAYAPKLSTTATSVYNQAAQAYSTFNSVVNSGSSVLDAINGNNPAQGKQAQAFLQFENWRDNRQLFNVQTPWRLYKNFAILSLTATQDEKTSMITDFLIVFKQMTFTSVNTITNISNIPSIPTTTTFTQPALGSSLQNAAVAQPSLAAPTSGSVPSVLPGTLGSGVFNI